MRYYLHDTAAFQDEKITELFIAHGYEGLGLFYTILEKLAAQEKPIKTVVLKKQLMIGKKLEKVWSFLEEIELISSTNGETFNENLLKFSENYQIKKEKTKERVAKWRDNQKVKENVTRYNDVSNSPKDKVKESKEKDNRKSASRTAQTLCFPDNWTPAMVNAYQNEWLSFRQRFKAKLQPESIVKQIEHLKNLPERALIDCLNYSITNGYQGLFPEKFMAAKPIAHTRPAVNHHVVPD